MRARAFLSLLLTILAAATAGGSGVTAAPSPPVLLVGDSVATGMLWHEPAVVAMQQELAVDWQVEICRTLTGTSCPFDGRRPPTLVQLVQTLGHVPPIVVVEMGYNDPAGTFAASVDQAMTALVGSGATHVLWLTLHAVRAPYPALNDVLEAATARWPQLELVDWNTAAANRWGWFQSDGVHLLEPGGIAMAHLVHAAVMRLVDPLHVAAPPPILRGGHRYSLRLRAAGGTPPYRWHVASGRPPRGFHLLASGRLTADLPRSAHASVTLAVTDADGVAAKVALDAR